MFLGFVKRNNLQLILVLLNALTLGLSMHCPKFYLELTLPELFDCNIHGWEVLTHMVQCVFFKRNDKWRRELDVVLQMQSVE